MSGTKSFFVKKTFLYMLIVSVVLGAGLGILAILSARFGWYEIRIILTTVIIAAASICGLACGAYWGTGQGRMLPLAGIILALVAAALIEVGMWSSIDSECYWKVTVSLSVFGIACAHLSLLSMAKLAGRFRWSIAAAHVIIFGVAGLITVMVMAEADSKDMFRFLGVAAIIDAAITILIPIFHRLSMRETGPDHAAIDAEIAKLQARIAELEKLKAN